jgi:hypothetical protein
MGNMSEFFDNKLFPIQGYEEDFDTGICAGGHQVVLGVFEPQLIAYFFDPEGNLLRTEHRSPQVPARGGYRDTAYSEWKLELGFVPGPIYIKIFFDFEEYVGIELIPEHLQPEEIAAEPDAELAESRAGWLEGGNFVWWWAKDYWMSSEGKVEST